jgi:hypothetical protein
MHVKLQQQSADRCYMPAISDAVVIAIICSLTDCLLVSVSDLLSVSMLSHPWP